MSRKGDCSDARTGGDEPGQKLPAISIKAMSEMANGKMIISGAVDTRTPPGRYTLGLGNTSLLKSGIFCFSQLCC
jgi:hypothetical protein